MELEEVSELTEEGGKEVEVSLRVTLSKVVFKSLSGHFFLAVPLR